MFSTAEAYRLACITSQARMPGTISGLMRARPPIEFFTTLRISV